MIVYLFVIAQFLSLIQLLFFNALYDRPCPLLQSVAWHTPSPERTACLQADDESAAACGMDIHQFFTAVNPQIGKAGS